MSDATNFFGSALAACLALVGATFCGLRQIAVCSTLHAFRHGFVAESLRDALRFRVFFCPECGMVMCDWCDLVHPAIHALPAVMGAPSLRCTYTWNRNNPPPTRLVRCTRPAWPEHEHFAPHGAREGE